MQFQYGFTCCYIMLNRNHHLFFLIELYRNIGMHTNHENVIFSVWYLCPVPNVKQLKLIVEHGRVVTTISAIIAIVYWLMVLAPTISAHIFLCL
jgi:hypothetical protein